MHVIRCAHVLVQAADETSAGLGVFPAERRYAAMFILLNDTYTSKGATGKGLAVLSKA